MTRRILLNFVCVSLTYLLSNTPMKDLVRDINDCNRAHHCLTCSVYTYNCATCPSGYALERGGAYYTCIACPSGCAECAHRSRCTACKIKNHYGMHCHRVCSKGCLNSTCEQLSGTCLCKGNYEGAHCDRCTNGKYGVDSNCTMDCPANCYSCISDKNCTECKEGFYGNRCELSCARGCYLGRCSQSSGTCHQNKCMPNFDGNNCEQCSFGRYGNGCKSKCPGNCVSCSSETTCDKCKDGFWGGACQQNFSNGSLGAFLAFLRKRYASPVSLEKNATDALPEDKALTA